MPMVRWRLKQQLLIAAGTVSTILGTVGIFVPVLPTTPFLLLAAACYLRSSERLYHWLVRNRLLGSYIASYLEGRGMSLRVKLFTILLLWTAIGLSIFMGTNNLAIRVVLLLVAIGVTIHICLLRTRKQR